MHRPVFAPIATQSSKHRSGSHIVTSGASIRTSGIGTSALLTPVSISTPESTSTPVSTGGGVLSGTNIRCGSQPWIAAVHEAKIKKETMVREALEERGEAPRSIMVGISL
jgi:hypothetical protein